MSRPWMPLYIADYLAGTAHLNAAEHGAYLLLIMHYWSKGGLPDSEDAIRRITRMTARQWSQSRDLLKSLFDDDWKHRRIDAELAKAIEISQVNSANAREAHRKRKEAAANSHQRTHTPSPSQSPSLPAGENARARSDDVSRGAKVPIEPDWTPNDIERDIARDAGLTDPEISTNAQKFRAHYRANGEARANWTEQWRKWCLDEKDRKPQAAEPVQSNEVNWDKAAAFYARTGRWWRDIGPEPGQAGCRCPRDVLTTNNIDPVTGAVKRGVP